MTQLEMPMLAARLRPAAKGATTAVGIQVQSLFGECLFGVWGLGFGVWGLGFGVWGLGFGVWGLGFGVWGLGFGVWGLGSRV